MDYPLTKALAVATLGYSAWVITHPDALRDQLDDPGAWSRPVARLAYTYAGRDVPISVLTLLGGRQGARTGALLRLAGDLTDAATLGATASSSSSRKKAVATALGYGVVNAVALVVDERRHSRA
ncbi:hypothetical protein [Nocardioides currus]|uniref:DUF4267 domain-containing protein n=1 Tax=Nocardioides currus TaxID=2133958 RepID=A0A2R7YUR2_9ACTN|nr:hypothetical protein [Nocardioides currus]PUA80150.1 hypothetical protein C7S10_16555 [Nocardioides currus]